MKRVILVVVLLLIFGVVGSALAEDLDSIQFPGNMLPPDRIMADQLYNLAWEYDQIGWLSAVQGVLDQIESIFAKYKNLNSFQEYMEVFGDELQSYDLDLDNLEKLYNRAVYAEKTGNIEDAWELWIDFSGWLEYAYNTEAYYYREGEYEPESEEYYEEGYYSEVYAEGITLRDYSRYLNSLTDLEGYLEGEGFTKDEVDFTKLNRLQTQVNGLVNDLSTVWEEYVVALESIAVNQPNPFEVAGIENPRKFTKIFTNVQNLVFVGDAESVAEYILYPMNANHKGNRTTIYSREEFIQMYDQIFTEKVKTSLINQNVDELFVNYQGVMVGNGEIWFGANVDGEYGIIAINY